MFFEISTDYCPEHFRQHGFGEALSMETALGMGAGIMVWHRVHRVSSGYLTDDSTDEGHFQDTTKRSMEEIVFFLQ